MFKFFTFVRATFIDLIELIKNSSNFLQQKLPPLVASNLMVPNPNGSRFWFYVNESLKKITTLIMMKLKAGSYIICVGLGHIQSNELTHTSADLTDINKRVIQVLWLLGLDSKFSFWRSRYWTTSFEPILSGIFSCVCQLFPPNNLREKNLENCYQPIGLLREASRHPLTTHTHTHTQEVRMYLRDK